MVKNKIETARILYHLPHFGISDIDEKRRAREGVLMKTEIINDSKLVNVCINILENMENPYDKIHSNPNYNFIILHLSDPSCFRVPEMARKNVYMNADIIKQSGSNAILVAESTIYPHGEEEILEHFDEYTDRIAYGNVLEDLLKKYGFIKNKKLRD